MFITLVGAAAPSTPHWPASFHGVGFRIDQLPDGTYQGVAQGGYTSRCYATASEALADITAWCDQQGGQ